jgi:hypothetical protein
LKTGGAGRPKFPVGQKQSGSWSSVRSVKLSPTQTQHDCTRAAVGVQTVLLAESSQRGQYICFLHNSTDMEM